MERQDLQVSLNCEVCKGQRNIHWKCIQCDLRMCDNCRTTHGTIPETSNHTMLSNSNISVNYMLEREIRRTRCKKHKERPYAYFCKTLRRLVCLDCLNDFQIKDDIIDISEFVTHYCNGKETAPEDYTSSPVYETDSGSFNMHCETICRYQDLQRVGRTPAFSSSPIHCTSDYSSSCGSNTTNSVKSNDQQNIGFLNSDFMRSESNMSTSSISSYVFVERSNSFDRMEYPSALIHYTNTHTYKMNLPPVNTMNFVNSHELYIGCQGGDISKINLEQLTLISRKPKILDRIKGQEAIDFTITSNGDILLINSEKKTINLVTKTYTGRTQVSEIHKFTEQVPISIHLNNKNGVLWIGLMEPNKRWKRASVGIIEQMLLSGNVISAESKSNRNKIRLFTKPIVIKEEVSSLFVIDQLKEMDGRIVAIDKDTREQQWTYSDCQTSYLRFLPTDLAVTDSRVIIVLDSALKQLHLLNFAGSKLGIQPLSSLRIEHPIRISYDNKMNYLWIGGGSKNTGAEIHKIQVEGI